MPSWLRVERARSRYWIASRKVCKRRVGTKFVDWWQVGDAWAHGLVPGRTRPDTRPDESGNSPGGPSGRNTAWAYSAFRLRVLLYHDTLYRAGISSVVNLAHHELRPTAAKGDVCACTAKLTVRFAGCRGAAGLRVSGAAVEWHRKKARKEWGACQSINCWDGAACRCCFRY